MSDEPETLEQLGATFGVSKERVRQLEVGAKKRLRARLEEIAGELLAAS
jgi:RNA polymerase sigma-32 factor